MLTTWSATLFICVGIYLRAFRFWSPSLWRDEYGTWWVVAEGWREVVHRGLSMQGQSPVYYLIVKLSTLAFGAGPFGLRLPSIVFGTITLALAYPLGWVVWKQRYAAVFVVAAAAVNGQLLWYSQEARPYALALCCVVLSFLCYARLLGDGVTARWRVGYVAATVAVFYAHYVFAFVVVVQMAHLLVVRGCAALRGRKWLLTMFVLGVLCSPGALQLASLAGRRAVLDWVPPGTWHVAVQLFIAYLNLPFLVVLGVVILLVGVVPLRARVLFDRNSVSLLALWLLLPIAVFGAASRVLGVTLLFDRYLLFILPAGLLVAAGLAALGRRDGWRGGASFALLLVASVAWYLVPSVQRTGGFGDRYNEDWAGAVQSLERVAGPGDAILYSTGFVEADQLRLPKPDPLLLSFIRAPLTANLHTGRQYPMEGLPFRVNAETTSYLRSLLTRAASSRRVVIIGLGEAVPFAAAVLLRTEAFASPAIMVHGTVSVIVLERRAG
jgi:hypothetical protein